MYNTSRFAIRFRLFFSQSTFSLLDLSLVLLAYICKQLLGKNQQSTVCSYCIFLLTCVHWLTTLCSVWSFGWFYKQIKIKNLLFIFGISILWISNFTFWFLKFDYWRFKIHFWNLLLTVLFYYNRPGTMECIKTFLTKTVKPFTVSIWSN